MYCNPTLCKVRVKILRHNQEKEAESEIKELLPETPKRSMDLVQEKGAPSWLTSLAIESSGFPSTKENSMMPSH